MKSRKFLIRVLFLFITLYAFQSCIEPIENFKQFKSESFLTIDALITNQPGPQTITLSQSAPKTSSPLIISITGARVYLINDKNQRIDFNDLDNGNYQSDRNFKAEKGVNYILYIDMPNGDKYISNPEKFENIPSINKIYNQFNEKDNFSKINEKRLGFDVYVDFKDNPATTDFYQFSWKHIRRTKYCAVCANGVWNNFSLKCDPVRFLNNTYLYTCNSNCFDIKYSENLNILSDALLNGKDIVGQFVARAPYDDRTDYYLEIEQRLISSKVFGYKRILLNATQNAGSLFDVPSETPYSINVKCTTDPNKKVLGIFEVSGILKRIVWIKRDKVPQNPLLSVPSGVEEPCQGPGCPKKASCVEGKFRTNITPAEWSDTPK